MENLVILCVFWLEKQTQFKPNYKRRIESRVDSRLRGNDKYGIPARWKILTLFEKTKPMLIWAI